MISNIPFGRVVMGRRAGYGPGGVVHLSSTGECIHPDPHTGVIVVPAGDVPMLEQCGWAEVPPVISMPPTTLPSAGPI